MEGVSKRKERGITLIALVITIIVLLILAGVTINLTIGERGIFTTAQDASKKYTVASEREYLQQDVLEYQMNATISDGKYTKLGVSLYDKTATNGEKWAIIQDKNNLENTYGTGWNYIEEGTNLENYGKARYNWIMNYETGEIKELEKDNYNYFNFESTVAVKEGLVFNYDSANVNVESLESFGDNAKLYYYDDEKYNSVETHQDAYNTNNKRTFCY